VDLLPIGRFARLTGLTVRAVRHYGELGLLRPAYVDPVTGYRYFAPEQVADAAAIRRLRFLELALDEIREILEADDPVSTRARLVSHRAKMAELAATTEQILALLQRIIEGKEALVPAAPDIRHEIDVKDVPEQPALVIRERAPLEKLPEIIPAAIDEVHARLQEVGAGFQGPPFVVCPFPDDDGLIALEIGWPVAEPVAGAGRVEATVLPACTVVSLLHRGHYQELDRTYRALDELVKREGLTTAGAPREIYETSPEEVPDPADWLTEVQLPIERDEVRIAALSVAGTGAD
jgi:DNA-binding transcriptional MerR regulator